MIIAEESPTETEHDAGRLPDTVPELIDALASRDYLADRGLATAIHLSMALGRPLLLEGEPGVGKTEVAKALADLTGAELIRLQCHEGIDANQALYEWDYTRQLVYMRALGDAHPDPDAVVADVFGERFLIERPLLAALRAGRRAVLLVDEVDRSDDEFEAFLLEVLSDFQVTVPEIGTIRATEPPAVVLTSNRTRELHDALKRRCTYHWIDYPDLQREIEIVHARAPEVPAALVTKVVTAVGRIRDLDIMKPPGVAETIDWARALTHLGGDLDVELGTDALGTLVKDRDDLATVRADLADILDAS